MTPTAITVGNVASVSGPVPGIFQGAPYGVDAFFAYINSQGGVNGRKLQRKFGDDGFNCNSAPVFQKNPNVADLAYVLDTDLENLSNNFSVSPQPPGWRTGPYIYYKEKYPDHLNVGSLYSNSAGGTFSWHGMRAAAESVGYKMVYERAVGPTETDFTSDVLRMRAAGVNFLATSGLDPNSIARLVNTVRQQRVGSPDRGGRIDLCGGLSEVVQPRGWRRSAAGPGVRHVPRRGRRRHPRGRPL